MIIVCPFNSRPFRLIDINIIMAEFRQGTTPPHMSNMVNKWIKFLELNIKLS